MILRASVFGLISGKFNHSIVLNKISNSSELQLKMEMPQFRMKNIKIYYDEN